MECNKFKLHVKIMLGVDDFLFVKCAKAQTLACLFLSKSLSTTPFMCLMTSSEFR